MTKNMTRRLGRAVAAITFVAGLAVVATPGAAQAAVLNCNESDEWGPGCWTTVTAINPGSYLAIHRDSNYTSGTLPGLQFHNGDSLYLGCWKTGDGDIDGHGDHYWFYATFGSFGGFVNDWYVNTGSPATWKPRIAHC